MNVNTYIPSQIEYEAVRAASGQNQAAAMVYIRYLENMLKRVERLADSYAVDADILKNEGHDEAAELMKLVSDQVRDASRPLASTSTPQPPVKGRSDGR